MTLDEPAGAPRRVLIENRNSKLENARLHSVAAPDFNLAVTLASGQVFHWLPLGSGYIGAIDATPVYVEQRADHLLTTVDPALVARYFALDHPMARIYGSFPDDPAMAAALDFCRGMRIIRQPAWECLATFIHLLDETSRPHRANLPHAPRPLWRPR